MSAKGPFLDFWVWGLGVWGLGLTILGHLLIFGPGQRMFNDEDISVQSSISDAGSYYFYAAIAFCAAILGMTVLPETKV